MRAVLVFNLNNPDDASSYKRAIKADNMYSMLQEFDNFLRDKAKHSDEKPKWGYVRNEFIGFLELNNVEIWE